MNNKGFSLIELLAAISIIAIISAILTPIVTVVIKQNKIDTCNNLIKSIETAASSYVSDNRYNPTVSSGNEFDIKLSVLKDNGYLKGEIINPLINDDVEGNHLDDKVIITYNPTSKTFNYTYDGTIDCSP